MLNINEKRLIKYFEEYIEYNYYEKNFLHFKCKYKIDIYKVLIIYKKLIIFKKLNCIIYCFSTIGTTF